jgi:hypothetical protein
LVQIDRINVVLRLRCDPAKRVLAGGIQVQLDPLAIAGGCDFLPLDLEPTELQQIAAGVLVAKHPTVVPFRVQLTPVTIHEPVR